MRGHIRKRSKDSWTVVVELPRDPETGKRRQKWVTVKGTKKEAERVAAELVADIERGLYGAAPAKLTVAEYLEEWLNTVKPRVRPLTFQTWQTRLKHWERAIGSKPLSRLTPLDVQKALNSFAETLAPTTCGGIFTPFRIAMKQAVKWGLIPKCPTDGVVAPSARKNEINVWTEEQIIRFLETVRKSKRTRYYVLFHTALATGMRLGELLGLLWEDVDLEQGVIHVRRSLPRWHGEPKWQEPKTPRARRQIPLDPVTLELLKQHRKKQLAERLKAGSTWRDYNVVFATKNGNSLQEAAVQATFKWFARKAGVPEIRFHDLRHTHATLLLRQGVHPKVVSERLGHSRVAFTLEVYSHVLPDTQKEACRAIERLWKGTAVCNWFATG